MNSQLEKLWRHYEWPELWELVKSGQEESSLAMRATLLACWWQENALAKQNLKQLPVLAACRNPWTIFCIALTSLCIGETKNYLSATAQLKRLKAPPWITQWLEIEYSGRSRQFSIQAKQVGKLLANGHYWACIPAIQTLNQKNIKPEFLATALAALPEEALADPLVGFLHRVLLGKQNPACILQLENNDNSRLTEVEIMLGANALYEAGEIKKAHEKFAGLNNKTFFPKYISRRWMYMVLSHPDLRKECIKVSQSIKALSLADPRFSKELAALSLIQLWADANYADAYQIVKDNYDYLSMPQQPDDRAGQIFFKLILSLCMFWQHHRALYELPNQPVVPLYVIGESHSLVPANAHFLWLSRPHAGKSCFVAGVKMHHLAGKTNNPQKACIAAQIAQIPTGADVMFTIGEIDCRPDEGIWPAAKKQRVAVDVLIKSTVQGYLDWLQHQINGKAFGSIAIQGIPASNHELEKRLSASEHNGYLKMVGQVNAALAAGAREKGWNFLDVYSATVAENGRSHGQLHLDTIHLKPLFYADAERWLTSA